nr:ATP-binding cassette domain-containing protein [Bacillus licheniformis]
MSAIQIRHVSRHFGNTIALEDVQLEVKEGEFFSLLGPSGRGKSTLLNIIAGFLEPTSGFVYIGGRDVTDLPPYDRHIGMVFQDYALFPHLSVFDNVAYGLKVRKWPRRKIEERVMECLALVRLEAFANRMPHQLSGGQRRAGGDCPGIGRSAVCAFARRAAEQPGCETSKRNADGAARAPKARRHYNDFSDARPGGGFKLIGQDWNSRMREASADSALRWTCTARLPINLWPNLSDRSIY